MILRWQISQQCGLHGCTLNHYALPYHYEFSTHHPWTDKPNILHDFDITVTFLLGSIHAVKHNLNPCQSSYPILYQSFAMEAQADATHCWIIVILLVQLRLKKYKCDKGKHGGITPPNISTALNFLKMCAEMIPDQVCVTIIPFYWMTAPLNSLKLIESEYL